jgi:hypothetical protein
MKKGIIAIFVLLVVYSQSLLPQRKLSSDNSFLLSSRGQVFRAEEGVVSGGKTIKENGSSENATMVARWAYGLSYACWFDKDNKLAYLGDGAYIRIFDMRNETEPVEVAKIMLHGVVKDIYVEASRCYAIDIGEFFEIDVSDPTAPSILRTYLFSGYPNALMVANNYAYVTTGRDGLCILSLDGEIQEVASYDTPGYARDVVVEGSYAYVADYDEGVMIIDIGNPANPQKAGHLVGPSGGYATRIALAPSGNYLYIADWYQGVRVADVSNANAPIEVGSFDTPGAATGIALDGNYAYVADTYALITLDISEPRSPQQVSYLDYSALGLAETVVAGQGYAYPIVERWGLSIVDMSNPANPQEVGLIEGHCMAHGVYSIENDGVGSTNSTIFVADGFKGLHILDFNMEGETLTELGHYDTRGASYAVWVDMPYAYVADGEGLSVIDVNNPSEPSEIGYWTGGSWTRDIMVAEISEVAGFGSTTPFRMASQPKSTHLYAFIADYGNGVRIIDVTDPNNPSEVGTCATSDNAFGVYVKIPYVYVAAYKSGLEIFDVRNITNPQHVGSFDTPGYSRKVYVQGQYAYVAVYDQGLRIIDVGDVTHPTEVSYYLVEGKATDVHVVDTYAYVTSRGLRIIDVSDVKNPNEVGYYDTYGSAYGVHAVNGYAYVADGKVGVGIIRNDLLSSVKNEGSINVTDFRLIGNYPNPFNPSTTIVFSVAKETQVILKVYDVLGREVKTLIEKRFQRGKYEFKWNGDDSRGNKVKSGVYFVEMVSGNYHAVIKTSLLK